MIAEDEFTQYVALIQSMSLDFLSKKLDPKTYLSNLKMMAKNMGEIIDKIEREK